MPMVYSLRLSGRNPEKRGAAQGRLPPLAREIWVTASSLKRTFGGISSNFRFWPLADRGALDLLIFLPMSADGKRQRRRLIQRRHQGKEIGLSRCLG